MYCLFLFRLISNLKNIEHWFRYPQLEWIKLPRIELLDRTEHTMHTMENKAYVIGGYSFRNHVASEIFPFYQVLELTINVLPDSSSNFSAVHRVIEIDIHPGLENRFITNFSSAFSVDSVYIYGGYCYPDYEQHRANMYQFCPPYTSRHVRPKQSSELIVMNLRTSEMEHVAADEKFATADGTIQIMTKNDQNKLESLLIVGGASGRLDMYSEVEFDLEKCGLDVEYGGCSMSLSVKNKDKLNCIEQRCLKIVHVACDVFTRGILKVKPEKYKCPACTDIDPETRKKRPKVSKSSR